ncbi:MAG: glycosyltransferase family 39 protein, partial [Acidimicrobiales bacterium]|nr:glycosyltransferase family 39 protein [Acidimicrobiales bacterium]
MQRATDWLSDPRTRIVAGWLVAIALAVTAALIVRGSTPTGSFGATDSQTYLSVAQNLTEGRGLTSSFTNEYDGVVPVDAVARSGRQALLLWPPLYPAALAAGTLVGSDPDHTTAPLGALGAAATALLAMRLVQRLTGSVVLSAAIVVLYLANIWSVLLFATVSSEVLYVPLLLAATLALVRALDAPTVWRLTAYAALAAATALTRYTGASLVLAGAVALAIWLPLPARRRWIAVGATTAAATIPLAVWTLWSRAGTSGRNRSIGWYDKGDDVRAFLALPTEWVLPPEDLSGARGWVLGALLVVAAVVAAVGWVTTARRAAIDPAASGFVDAEARAVRAAGPVLAEANARD